MQPKHPLLKQIKPLPEHITNVSRESTICCRSSHKVETEGMLNSPLRLSLCDSLSCLSSLAVVDRLRAGICFCVCSLMLLTGLLGATCPPPPGFDGSPGAHWMVLLRNAVVMAIGALVGQWINILPLVRHNSTIHRRESTRWGNGNQNDHMLEWGENGWSFYVDLAEC